MAPRQLPDRRRRTLPVGGGYARVPDALVAPSAGVDDLGVCLWSGMQLRYGEDWAATDYPAIAAMVGADPGPAGCKRIQRSVRGLAESGWLRWRRAAAGSNSREYQILGVPAAAGAQRYAWLRRADLARLRDGDVKPQTVADFARWQLVCGSSGWTDLPLTELADRWQISYRSLKTRRQIAAAAGMLLIDRRHGLRDVTWLAEAQDLDEPLAAAGEIAADERAEGSTANGFPGVDWTEFARPDELSTGAKDVQSVVQHSSSRVVQNLSSPYKEELTTDCQTGDLSILGAASVAPLRSPTRESDVAAPEAPNSENHRPAARNRVTNRQPPPEWRMVAEDLVAGSERLRRAEPWWRRACLRTLTAGLAAGVDPELLQRHLLLVTEEQPDLPHLTAVRRALAQARADTLAGQCPHCGGRDTRDESAHDLGCPCRVDTIEPALEPDATLEQTLLAAQASLDCAGRQPSRPGAPARKTTTADPRQSGPAPLRASDGSDPHPAENDPLTPYLNPGGRDAWRTADRYGEELDAGQAYTAAIQALAEQLIGVPAIHRRTELRDRAKLLRCRRTFAARRDIVDTVVQHLDWVLRSPPPKNNQADEQHHQVILTAA